MIDEIIYRLWHAHAFGISRRSDSKVLGAANSTRNLSRVAQRTNSYGDVDAFFNQIDVALRNRELDADVRELSAKARQVRNNAHTPKGWRQGNPHHAGRRRFATADASLDIVHALDDRNRTFVEALASLCQAQASRASAQQLRAEPCFETRNRLACRWLTDSGRTRRLREVAAVGNTDEEPHDIDSIHWNFPPTI
ncbi:hypothetical protein P9292_39900 [Caballeronia sp. LZ001]|nr:hypothetical protein [Caballeronia sp. LZ001]MDR5806157.1 hypothetical protein [Caballeronia sp. LZ001]